MASITIRNKKNYQVYIQKKDGSPFPMMAKQEKTINPDEFINLERVNFIEILTPVVKPKSSSPVSPVKAPAPAPVAPKPETNVNKMTKGDLFTLAKDKGKIGKGKSPDDYTKKDLLKLIGA